MDKGQKINGILAAVLSAQYPCKRAAPPAPQPAPTPPTVLIAKPPAAPRGAVVWR